MASAAELPRFHAVDRRAGLLVVRRGIAQQAGRELQPRDPAQTEAPTTPDSAINSATPPDTTTWLTCGSRTRADFSR
jgi:hypothetical protein